MSRLTRLFFMAGALLALPAAGANSAAAQDSRTPIVMLVGYPAGGSADATARIIAENLATSLGQPVVVENRVGAGGQIAARALKNAPADGSVIFMSNSHTAVTVPLVMKDPGFTTLTDFTPISNIATYALALAVHPMTNANTVEDFIKWMKANPKQSNIAIPAPASSPEFMVDQLKRHFGIPIQSVSYRGTAPAMQDLLGGQVIAAIVPVTDLLPYRDTGQIKILAVTNETPALPQVPSFSKLGIDGLDLTEFYALYAPAGLPAATAQRYGAAVRQFLQDPKIVNRFAALGIDVLPGTPEQQAEMVKSLSARMSTLISASGFKPQ